MGSISRIEDLPDVLLFNGILSQLDAFDLVRLACCSTRLNKTAAADELWYPIYKRYNNDHNKGKEPPPSPWQTWQQAFWSKQADKLIGPWIKTQCDGISKRIERTIQQKKWDPASSQHRHGNSIFEVYSTMNEKWDPASSQHRHGNSIFEVYSTMNETVNQFFKLQLPMSVLQPNGLISGLDNALQAYTKRVVSQLVNIEYLIQSAPIVTICKNEGAYAKKVVPDRNSTKVDALTTQKLCVHLNSLNYVVLHLKELEDSIRQRWAQKGPQENVMEAFGGTREAVGAAIDRICEFTGMKIIFWDIMRKSCFYTNSVLRGWMNMVLERLRSVLVELRDVIVDDALRDRVVTWLLRASVKGLTRVLCHGGSSRVFSQRDAKLVEENLQRLKNFFTTHGWGIPHTTVENVAAREQQTLWRVVSQKLHASEQMPSGYNAH